MGSNAEQRNVLLLENDLAQRGHLSRYLSGQGLIVTAPENHSELMDLANQPEFGLALLDTTLCSACTTTDTEWGALFQRDDLGVIMLSARDNKREKIDALEGGADDYISKPVHEIELLARIRAVMRRYPAQSRVLRPPRATGWLLNSDKRSMTSPNGTHVELTRRESQLLVLLFEHQGEAVSRDMISRTLMGRDWLPGDRATDVLVRRLRGKLGPAGGRDLVKTVRHIGYSVPEGQVAR